MPQVQDSVIPSGVPASGSAIGIALPRWLHRLSVLLILALLSAAARASHQTHPFSEAVFQPSQVASPAQLAETGERVRLPDLWSPTRERATRQGWYRIQFEVATLPTTLQALYVPRANRNAAFYINGSYVGSGGPIDDPYYRNAHRSHYYVVPPAMLRVGRNELDVRLVTGGVGRNGISEIYLGDDADLRPTNELQRFHQEVFPWVQNGINLYLILFIVLYWFIRRSQHTLLLFAAALTCWTLRNFLYLQVHALPVDDALHDFIQRQLLCGVFAFLWVFSMRFVGARSRIVDVSAATLLIAPCVLEWIIPDPFMYAYRAMVYLFAGGVGVMVSVLLGREAFRSGKLDHWLVFLAAAFVVLVSVYDFGVSRNLFGFTAPFALQYAALPMFIIMGWAMLKSLIDSIRYSESLAQGLEARVAEKHRELEANYARINAVERQAAVADERARMMQDMHDGMGSYLMTTLAMVETSDLSRKEVVEALRACIDDMRLTIDSLQPEDNDLASLLGNMRYRLEPRLRAAGVELEWKVNNLRVLENAGPHALLQVLRIVQEAITNVLKHSRATRVVVETYEAQDESRLVIADNGTGLDRSQPTGPGNSLRRGRGISNMHNRARALGARIEHVQEEVGHSVVLIFDNSQRRKPELRAAAD